MSRYAELAERYSRCLTDSVVPFWSRCSVDHKCGGYLTCLDTRGEVYDTDKFVWLQARQVWTYSMLHECLERRGDWLGVARHGAEFLLKHGRDAEGNWYFSLARDGRPLVQPYNIFSDCFAAMAFAAFGRATGEASATDVALQTWKNILARRDDPKGVYNKAYPGTRQLRGFALPMILCNLAGELADVIGADEVEHMTDECIRDVMDVFLDRGRMLVRENVLPDGSHDDSFEGRLVNPGHGIEGMWFIMAAAERRGDKATIDLAAEAVLSTLAFAWDQDFGGMYYFLDAEGRPPLQLEWDQKLWWVHVETLIALLMAFRLTGRDECWEWFRKVHDYAWSHFADDENGEWFGYLNRRGEVLLPIKGGKWKGCFHVPRGLYRCGVELDRLAAAE
jgi:N-acylglucosamine 2-epimerase